MLLGQAPQIKGVEKALSKLVEKEQEDDRHSYVDTINICVLFLRQISLCACSNRCGHVFHEDCIFQMRRQGGSGRCPLCRRIHADLTPLQNLLDSAILAKGMAIPAEPVMLYRSLAQSILYNICPILMFLPCHLKDQTSYLLMTELLL